MKLCAVSDSLEICHSKRPARVSADLGIGWPVLLAFSAGAAGDKSELRSNSELVAGPDGISAENVWERDPRTERIPGHTLELGLGSLQPRLHSYVPVGSKQSLRRRIGMPVENRIFFTGEATSPILPVHGPRCLPLRSASRLRNHARRQQGRPHGRQLWTD